MASLVKKAQLEDETTHGPIRVYETHASKIHRELTRETYVASITDYVSLVAERIPSEELAVDPGQTIQAFHFQGEPSKSHGIPFKFYIIPVRDPKAHFATISLMYRVG